MRPILLACVALLAGCAAQPVKVVATTPTIVTKTVYVAIPEGLTVPCAKPTPLSSIKSNGSLLKAYLDDADALVECGARIEAIRSIKRP